VFVGPNDQDRRMLEWTAERGLCVTECTMECTWVRMVERGAWKFA
jgi:hypothetical protein